MEWLQLIFSHRLSVTLFVALGGILVREGAIRWVRKRHDILTPAHRRTMSIVHHVTVLVIVLTIVVLWAPQIREFALSITAIAVAFVIATKELLLCLSGALVTRTARAFVIGDWIEVNDRFGEVIERNLLTTTIQQIESRGYSYTGRMVMIPNSVFLVHTVLNQTFLRRYQFHQFSITIEPDAFPIDAEAKLAERIEALTEPFRETAERYNKLLEKRTGIDIPDARPLIEFSTNELAKLVTTITVFCPTGEIATLEKSMTQEFLGWYRGNRHAPKEA